MFKLKQFCTLPVIFLLFLLVFHGTSLAEETITITTYYPSPYGVYREMRAKRIAIGDNYLDRENYTWEEADGDGGDIDYLADLVVEGNVGIGTANPSALLEVSTTTSDKNAEVRIFKGTGSDTDRASLKIGYNDAASFEIYRPRADGTIYLDSKQGGDLQFKFSSGTAKVVFAGNGNVGIGTTSPAAKLDVRGAVYAPQQSSWSTGGFRAIYSSAGTNNYRHIYVNSTGGQLRFYNGSNEPYIDDSGVWHDASDIALKKDIGDLKYGLNELMELKPRFYRMKSDDSAQIGFIAQEVEKIIPEVVSGQEGNKGLSYGQLVALAIKGIQEQQRQIEKQQQQIEELKEELAGLKKEKIEEK